MEEVENAITELTVDSSEKSGVTIPVKKRAFGVFTLMFPATAEEAAKGIGWG
ncbi:hypothetical protein MMC16_002386 [Acarospora aff. strigata]|nr:hypothetical protein [Acarospora aff. strigata]